MLETTLSLIVGFNVVTLATAVAAIAIARAKAPPESNEQIALKVSKMQIELEDVFDALDKWNKRASVRASREKAAMSPEQAQDAIAGRTGILRQPLAPGARLLGGKQPS